MNERSIFLAALDIADPAKRAAFLAESCGDDATLRRQVEGLLAAHDRSGDFLDVPALQQMAGEQTSDQIPALADVDLSFLKPPTSPGTLGRLGNYEIREVLGRGGCGIVFKAFDERLNRSVAIKVLAPELAATSPARKRFVREAQAAAAIRHENVVAIHDVGAEPIPFLVMEYIAGQTLQEKLDATGPLDPADIVRIGRQIALGMQAAHEIGLVHRDIKPGNVLVEAGTERVKLTDFGLARAGDDASLTQSGMIAGTPLYMSPEQASGATIDSRSDLFSLGSVLYVMASGRPPFRASTTLAVLNRVANDEPRPIREIIPEVPEWLVAVIAKLHAKKPADRYATGQEVADVLGRGGEGQRQEGDVRAKRQAASAESTRRPRRRWAAAALVLAAILAALGVTEATGVTDVRGTVLRLWSPDGTLVVEVDDPSVSFRIDGEEMVITGAGIRELRVSSGRHRIEMTKDGKLVRQELVNVARNGRQVVRVSREPQPVGIATALDPDRRAAEWVLSIAGNMSVLLEDGKLVEIHPDGVLPRGVFELTSASLNHNPKVTDQGLAQLKDCKNLEIVALHFSRVSDAGLVHLKSCENLANLSLAGTQVTDAGLASLTALKNLASLDLNHNPKITDAALKALAGCPKLRNLYAKDTEVTEAGVKNLQAALPKCRIEWDSNPDRRAAEYVLSIGGGVRVCIDDDPVPIDPFGRLPKQPIKLTLVRLGYNTKVTEAGLAAFRGCKDVTALELPHTAVTDAGLANFRNCKNLEYVDLSGTDVGDDGVAHLAGCTNLTTLSLLATQVGDRGLANFKGCTKLRVLRLWGNGISDAGLKYFSDCLDLESLNVHCQRVRDGGLANFAPCRKIAEISLTDTPITDAALAWLTDCKDLRALSVERTRVSDALLTRLGAWPKLKHLNVAGVPLTDAGFAGLREDLPQRDWTLQANEFELTESRLEALKSCAGLTGLWTHNTKWTDADLDRLHALDQMRWLNLTGPRITAAGGARLAAALPKCKVIVNGKTIEP